MIATYDVNLYKPTEDCTVTIHEDGDGLGMICVKADRDYFGKIDFSMNHDDARALANGILKAIELARERG